MNYVNSDDTTQNEDSDDSEDTGHVAFEPHVFTPSADVSNEHEEPQEDDDSSDDEVESVSSEYSDTNNDPISARLWPHEKSDEPSVRSPISTEPWAIEYTSHIKDLIQTALMKIGIMFFIALSVLCVGSMEIPVIVVLTDTSENAVSASKILENIVRSSDYVWIFGKGTIQRSASRHSNTQYPRYHKHIQCGHAIEARKDESGTAGLFIHKANSRHIHGITAGHVFENMSAGGRVLQPPPKHFKMDIEDVEYRILLLQSDIKRTRDNHMRSKYEDDLRDLQQHLDILYGLKGATDRETRKNLKVGKILSHECCPVVYLGRNCLSDWGIFEVSRERRPEMTRFDSRPATGVLATKVWSPVNVFGRLKWDQWVRKTGHVTGLTFGFVAGVYAGWNPGIPNCPPLTEFYVIEEKTRSDNRFATKGDSGAAAITPEGNVVGFVFGIVDITDIEVIVDIQSKVPDILTIANRRRSDGSVDENGLWWDWFESKSFILVECAEMVKMRAGIEEEIFQCN